ncbi:HRDC-like protein [Polychytrium aggregatum]|uniref:HRDC-like protein n=1 Tax=Polychytrium aggregatum TaxID=110093 RepID=UPI0022FE317F|nr:HRDC-like protein [Polychytrium aggregatum]KAI9202189.1 HRDC-like protein [Polychytrium aggregatum]
MEVLDLRSTMITNAEVIAFIKEVDQQRKEDPRLKYQSSSEFQDLNTVEFEVLKYAQKHPMCDPSQIPAFVAALAEKSYQLTKAEKLQLINQRPVTQVHLYQIIEECEKRLSDEDQANVMHLVRSMLK